MVDPNMVEGIWMLYPYVPYKKNYRKLMLSLVMVSVNNLWFAMVWKPMGTDQNKYI
jgi:hypothetical protein